MNKVFMVLVACILSFAATVGHTQEVAKTQNTAEEISLKNGFYLILEEQADTAKLQTNADEVVVTYTLDHLGVFDQPPLIFG